MRRLLFADEAPAAQFGAGQQQPPGCGAVEAAAVEEEPQTAVAGGFGGSQSTTRSLGTCPRCIPISSATSRIPACAGASPFSTTPPGNSQPGLYVGSTSSTLSCSSKRRTPAASVSEVGSGVWTISQGPAAPERSASAIRSAVPAGVSAVLSTVWASAVSQPSAVRYGSMCS